MSKFVTFSGTGLNARLTNALNDAGVTESNNHCERISAYMLHSKSDNTVKKYFSSFQMWKYFCIQHNYTAIPAQPIHIVLYLTKMLDAGSSAGGMNGLGDPTEEGFVKNLHESGKRIRLTKTVKKDAITSDMLIELCDVFP